MKEGRPLRPRRRLWHKLALVLVAVGVLPLLFAAWLIADSAARRVTESARAYHLATAEVALGETRGLVARALAELRSLGELLARAEDADRREAAARAKLLGAELVDDVALFDPSGKRVLVLRSSGTARWSPPEALGADVREQALSRGHVTRDRDVAGAVALELIVPLWRGETPYAFLVSAVDLTPLSELVAGLALRHYADARRMRLLNAELRVIAASERALVGTSLAGSQAVMAVTNEGDGGKAHAGPFTRNIAYTVDYDDATLDAKLIGAIVPLPELGWAVLVDERQDEAYAAVTATWRTAALVGTVVALVALVLALVLGRRLAMPIEAMAEATSRVSHGDFEVRVPVVGRDEIAATATAFNYMASDLAGYRESLVAEARARENLSRFLSPEVVERVVKGREALTLGGERRTVTVLFADVVGFTRLAEERAPEEAVAILNELFTIVSEIVFQHGGIIDKFIGDCVMAIWGAPHAHADDARRAVRAAEAILRWLEIGNAKWKKQIGRDIELAMGIHTGSAVVGNIGSEKRMDYTAIGDAVNVAARLERLARPGQILITRETMQLVGDEFPSQSIGTYDIIGPARPSEIFVLGQ